MTNLDEFKKSFTNAGLEFEITEGASYLSNDYPMDKKLNYNSTLILYETHSKWYYMEIFFLDGKFVFMQINESI